MVYIKHIERSAVVAFAPSSPLIASGTAAGAIDLSFSSNSVLEIFSVDLASPLDLPVVGGAIPVHERFNRLAWGAKPAESLSLPHGILAGGLSDGSINVWDPAVIIDGSAKLGKNPVLAKLQQHTGEVKGLQFNTFSPNLLASGAGDGDLCIWDLTNPATPSLYPALKGGAAAQPGRGPEAEITYLAWNPRVQHILASTNTNGSTVVWDLKKQRPVLSFRDPNSHRRCSVLHWHPDEARQLVVASDDDRSPTLQMWDLRNSAAPLKEFVGHTKGVLGMDWCPHDSSLLLSCGKDSRTICWDVATADVVCELPATNEWHVDVQWSPITPGIFAAASCDSKVGFCNLVSCTASSVVETVNADFSVTKTAAGSTPLKRAPAWMQRPAGATFGFGGKLVSFAHQKQQQQDANGQLKTVDVAAVNVRQVVSEQDLVRQSEAFESAIAGGNERSTLKEFCFNKASVASADEAETWQFLSILFEEDARRQLLVKLGLSDALTTLQSVPSANGVDTVAAAVDQMHVSSDGQSPAAGAVPAQEDFSQNEESFFENLAEQPIVEIPGTGLADGDVAASPKAETPRHTGLEDVHHSESEEDIQKALFVGNYDSAVDHCIKAGRMADALLIANICGAELYKRTMHRYMKQCHSPYMRIINAMVNNDYMSLVKTRPVGQWKETLAVLATYSGPDQWSELCDALAARLAAAGLHHAASLCYICAGNVEQVVGYWSRASKSATASVDVLQSIIEKAVVMGLAINSKKASTSLSDLVTNYAGILASEGRMGTALEYLDMVPGEASSTVAILRDRIYRCGAQSIPAHMNPPPFPFIREEVKTAPQAPAPASAATSQYQNSYNGTYGNSYQQQAYNNTAQPTAYATPTPAYNTPTPAQPSAYAAPTAYSNYNTQPTAAASAFNYSNAQPAASSYAPTSYSTAQPAQSSAYSYNTPAATPSYSQPAAEPAPVYTVTPSRRTAPPPQPALPPVNTYAAQPVAAAPPPVNVFTPGAPTQQAAPVQTVPAATGFAPVNAAPPPAPISMAPNSSPGQQHAQPMIPSMPHQAPPQSPVKPPPPPAPTGPPANITMQTADTSKVPADQRPVVGSFINLYSACMPAAANAVKKREMDDNSKRLGQLFWKLNAGEVSPAVVEKLMQLAGALDRNDWHSATHIQVEMTATHWDECGSWLSAVKRLIKTRQMMG